MRAFLAVALPPAARERLAALQRQLAGSGADVKWVEPENLHLTMKFLGEIDERLSSALIGRLGPVAGATPPFEAQLNRVGAFPAMGAPRVVWVGIGPGVAELRRLAEAIEHETAALGLEGEPRPFAAHVTVGRVRSSNRRQALVRALQDAAWTAPPPWPVRAVTLYQSLLSSSGPRYTVLADLPLQAA
jgi:2'-5' RNA ligase